jgi:tRNA(Ile)-lysidine synthase TilS/MesJ
MYGLKMHTCVLPLDERDGPGFQQRARNWRRLNSVNVFNKMISEESTPSIGGGIVLGHHNDDQIETVLMKLLRGVHLANIQPVSKYSILHFRSASDQ